MVERLVLHLRCDDDAGKAEIDRAALELALASSGFIAGTWASPMKRPG
jgi:hypothetical protein